MWVPMNVGAEVNVRICMSWNLYSIGEYVKYGTFFQYAMMMNSRRINNSYGNQYAAVQQRAGYIKKH